MSELPCKLLNVLYKCHISDNLSVSLLPKKNPVPQNSYDYRELSYRFASALVLHQHGSHKRQSLLLELLCSAAFRALDRQACLLLHMLASLCFCFAGLIVSVSVFPRQHATFIWLFQVELESDPDECLIRAALCRANHNTAASVPCNQCGDSCGVLQHLGSCPRRLNSAAAVHFCVLLKVRISCRASGSFSGCSLPRCVFQLK